MSNNSDRYDGYRGILLSRRGLLKGVLGAGIATSLTAIPWWTRPALAMRRADATAKRVLVIYFAGGMRSSTGFHASPSARKYNPWGVIDGTGTPFVLGKLLDDFLTADSPVITPETAPGDGAYTLSAMGPWAGMRVPRFREIAQSFSVVGSWNTERGDHYRSSVEESTGSPDGTQAGLLSRIATGVDAAGGIPLPPDDPGDAGPMDVDASTPPADDAGDPGDGGDADASTTPPINPADEIPAFHIEPGSAFSHTTEATARFTPVPLFGIGGLPSRDDGNDGGASGGRDWARDDVMRARLDQRRLAARVGYGRTIVQQYASDRVARLKVGQRLTAPWVDVENNPMQARGTVRIDSGTVPLTNGMLLELFTRALGPDPMGDGSSPYANPNDSDFYRTALDVALAVRLLQMGSPAIAVEMGGFDTHSGERRDAPQRFRFIGRLWATLNFLLSRIPEPGEPGVSMLDRTLVVTMSEFGRDPGSDSSGFNNGEGSDHGSDPSCYYYAHAVMGGGVVPNRHVGAAPPTSYVPAMADRLPPRALLATTLWAMGLENDNPDWGFPDVQPITQLFMR